ncbi:YopX family protein [Sulfuricurvum sp.]|uniref:YopX family protein n=1 Tax=Sulfuricurvum sp. TaxID=2025608 RepID=UPI003562BDB5
MRIIKFRAWDKDVKEMEIVGAIYWDGYGKVITCNTEGHKHYMTEPDQFILMQFTGLLDKNGKEIYEGDLLQFDNDSSVCFEVFYDADEARFNCCRVHYHGSRCGCYIPKIESKHLSVIGNIYENPKLLEANDE